MGPTCRRSRISSREKCLRRTRAATPCGDSLGTRLSNNLSGSRRVSTWAPICGSRRSARSCADSRKNTELKPGRCGWPLRECAGPRWHSLRFGEFGVGKSLAQLLNQRIVAAFDAAEARMGGETRLFHSLDYRPALAANARFTRVAPATDCIGTGFESKSLKSNLILRH